MMRSRSLYGGHPSTIVVADDIRIVEHRGNTGRPHAAAKPSRTLIQRGSSSLRCEPTTFNETKPNTTNPNPRAPKEALDTQTSTGNNAIAVAQNAGSVRRCYVRRSVRAPNADPGRGTAVVAHEPLQDLVDVPGVGDAFEDVFASIGERDSATRGEVFDGA